MISQIVAVVLLALAAVAVEGASVALENDFIKGKSFGPVTYRVKDEKTGKVGLRTSRYLEVKAPNTWQPLQGMCRTELDDDKAHRLYLETCEEFQIIEDFLSNGVTIEPLYWTGGEWNSRLGRFQWDNGVPFGELCEDTWEYGVPEHPLASTKVALSTRFTSYLLRNDSEDTSHSFICELDYDETCILDSDLVVVLDGSGSVSLPNFDIAKQFIANLTDAWLANANNRISLIVFATNTTTEFSLDNGLSASEIKEKISNAGYPAGSTFTHLGLEVALGELSRNNRTFPQNMVLITDGYSSDPTQTLVNAKMLLDAGVETFAVGVGSFNPDELLAVAGGNDKHVFTTDGFEGLVDVLESLQEVICKN